MDLDLFFSFDKDAVDAALDYCRVCPVVDECLMDDLSSTSNIYGIHGVRGGMTERERRAFARRTQRKAG